MSVRFAGYAALFDRIDRGGDIVRRGAFTGSLGGGGLPLLWQHRPDRLIGRIEHASEDRRGLRVIAALDDGATEALAALRSGAVMGLSFGYRVRKAMGSHPRELIDLDLVEVSLVSVPMMPGAKVHMLR
ncbi:HK97 family phage prohead protease [Blastomonas sp. AAP53]|uniref:HK97 family phage prohead protease n=1 Tax=Blastomonas sp. AAP53 TaxID=1248760 RepID=UPI0002FFF278|nr:HK97 family phage prohead protease [Blastomonas sp. AAP53]